MTADWHGAAYERVSSPQFRWGARVLDRLALRGDETVIDAGCGTGRLTERLLERLPRGRVIAVDRSASMLEVARAKLAPRYGYRLRVVEADLQTFVSDEPADAIFSTATFHWVLDHDRLFRNLHDSLGAGGVLEAQCGGGPNLARLLARVRRLIEDPARARRFEDWSEGWYFATPDLPAERLRAAGFTDVRTSLEEEPTPFPDAASFREFVAEVVLRQHLARLPEDERAAFLAPLIEQAASDTPPFTLDYWRLNLHGRRA